MGRYLESRSHLHNAMGSHQLRFIPLCTQPAFWSQIHICQVSRLHLQRLSSFIRMCRKLERRYRHSKTSEDRQAWVEALHKKHIDFEAKKTQYWTNRISCDSDNPPKLWQSMSQFLGCQNSNESLQSAPHTADTFLKYFGDKVLGVQSGTCIIIITHAFIICAHSVLVSD